MRHHFARANFFGAVIIFFAIEISSILMMNSRDLLCD